MDNMFSLPNPKSGGPWIFNNPSNPNTQWDQFFDIPRWANLLQFLVIGAGSGGGGGSTQANSTQKGGGAGGQPGGAFKLTIPASILPSRLYISIGQGGAGGAAGATGQTGGSGNPTFISLDQSAAFLDTLIASTTTATGSTGGGPASGGSVGTLGAFALTGGFFSHYGSEVIVASLAGANGPTSGNGSSVAFSSGITCGGAAGGGCTTGNAAGNGGSITFATSTLFPTSLSGGTGVVGTGAGNNGADGYALMRPMFFTGGAGGGGTTNGQGGNGGNGGPGCGGGGGGAGNPAGSGGNGGNALIMIWAS
jgi:hypothetical protein